MKLKCDILKANPEYDITYLGSSRSIRVKCDLVTFLVSDLPALNQTQYTYSVGLVSLFVTLLIILILRSQEGGSFRPCITNS